MSRNCYPRSSYNHHKNHHYHHDHYHHNLHYRHCANASHPTTTDSQCSGWHCQCIPIIDLTAGGSDGDLAGAAAVIIAVVVGNWFFSSGSPFSSRIRDSRVDERLTGCRRSPTTTHLRSYRRAILKAEMLRNNFAGPSFAVNRPPQGKVLTLIGL